MTTPADDASVENAFEAFLAGRPVPEEAADSSHAVVAFAGAVRATAHQPGRPNAALADLLATGLLTDQSSPSIRTATSAGKSPRRSRVRRRRRFAMFFPALLAKFLSAGAVAQAASGAGICLVAFTGAGAAGVLPGPVQDTFSSVVGTETADETPAPEDTTGSGTYPVVDTQTGDVTDVVDPAPETPVDVGAPVEPTEQSWAADGPDAYPTFGAWVSFGRQHGWGNGDTVSCWAHHRNDERKGRDVTECAPATSPDPTDDGSGAADAPDAETPEVETRDDDSSDTQQSTDDSDRSGHGNGSGHGNSDGHGNGHN